VVDNPGRQFLQLLHLEVRFIKVALKCNKKITYLSFVEVIIVYFQYCCISGLHPSFSYKMKTRRFGSCLWCCSQVKIPTPSGPIEEANPNPWVQVLGITLSIRLNILGIFTWKREQSKPWNVVFLFQNCTMVEVHKHSRMKSNTSFLEAIWVIVVTYFCY
jgi:hypothetical protein